MSDKTKGGLAALDVDRQCRANSRQTGERCRRTVPLGHVVCHYHGGASKQAKDKAKLRLLELLEPAVAGLARLMVNSADERVRLRAIENVLDRAGMPRGVKMEGGDARALLVARLEAYRETNGLPDVATTAAVAVSLPTDDETEEQQ